MTKNVIPYLIIISSIIAVMYFIITQPEDITDQEAESNLKKANNSAVREFQFTYNVALERSDGKVEVWIPAPQSNEVQTVTNLNIDSGSMRCESLMEKSHGNAYYYCESEKLEEPTNVSIECNVIRKEHGQTKYDNVSPLNYDRGTLHRTVPEGEFFSEIISEASLSSDDVRAVYDYVLSGMHYGKPKEKADQYYSGRNPKTGEEWLSSSILYGRNKVSKDDVVDAYIKASNDKTDYTFGKGNSKYACNIGVGNCTDYHSYFISLCRTLDVPARFHMGFSIPLEEGKTEGKVGGYHCWADYYTDDEGWTPVDISEADKDPSKANYFFGTINENRVEFMVGRDFELKNREYPENFFIYPLVEGTDYTKSFYYKNL